MTKDGIYICPLISNANGNAVIYCKQGVMSNHIKHLTELDIALQSIKCRAWDQAASCCRICMQ